MCRACRLLCDGGADALQDAASGRGWQREGLGLTGKDLGESQHGNPGDTVELLTALALLFLNLRADGLPSQEQTGFDGSGAALHDLRDLLHAELVEIKQHDCLPLHVAEGVNDLSQTAAQILLLGIDLRKE